MAHDQKSGGYDPTGNEEILTNFELPIMLVVDNSYSMEGDPIGQVNDGARRVLEFLQNDLNDSKTQPKFACLAFSDEAIWINGQNPYIDAKSYVWHDINVVAGTKFGKACEELHKILLPKNEGGWLAGRKNCLKPVIIVMSDGQSEEYKSKLDVLKKRGWYKKAIKFGIAIGSHADKNMLVNFTGNPEYVYDTDHFKNRISDIIKIIVQQSSVVSTTVDTDDDDANKIAAQNISANLNGAPGLGSGDEQP